MQRRNFIAGAGAALAGGAALALGSRSASAQVETGFTATGDSLTNDDGSVRSINLNINGMYDWDGFDNPADQAEITISASVGESESYEEIASTTQKVNGQNGEGSYSFSEVDLTETFGDEVFESSEDGESSTTSVTLKVSVNISTTGSNSSVSTEASDSMSITVNNQEAESDISADASATASSYDHRVGFDKVWDDGDATITFDASSNFGAPFYVEETYNENQAQFVLDLPAGFTDESQDNAAIIFDKGPNGQTNFQVIWHASEDPSVKTYDGSSWSKTLVENYSGVEVDINSSNTRVAVAVDTSILDGGNSEFKWTVQGFYAGAGASEYDTLDNTPIPAGSNATFHPESASSGSFINFTDSEDYFERDLNDY